MSFASSKAVPTIADALSFTTRAWALRLRRTVLELAGPRALRAHARGAALTEAPIVGEVRSPL
jgi:hypothetical protein